MTRDGLAVGGADTEFGRRSFKLIVDPRSFAVRLSRERLSNPRPTTRLTPVSSCTPPIALANSQNSISDTCSEKSSPTRNSLSEAMSEAREEEIDVEREATSAQVLAVYVWSSRYLLASISEQVARPYSDPRLPLIAFLDLRRYT